MASRLGVTKVYAQQRTLVAVKALPGRIPFTCSPVAALPPAAATGLAQRSSACSSYIKKTHVLHHVLHIKSVSYFSFCSKHASQCVF